MSDPRDFERPGLHGLDDRNADVYADARNSNAMWGWIAGAVFLVIVLALIFGPTGSGDNQTALTESPAPNSLNTAPPASGTPITRTAPPPTAMPPASPPTTGQGGSTSQ